MNGEKTDIYELIYEFDKDSPMFARAAYNEMERGEYINALKILERGLKRYPKFAAAYFLKALVLNEAGVKNEALAALDKGSELLNDSGTNNYYRNKIAPEQEEEEPEEKFDDEERDLPPDNPRLQSAREELKGIINNFSDELDTEETDSETEYPEPSPAKKESLIVSDTMAGIYMAQGSLEEALYIYNKLKEKNPSKPEFYDEKIEHVKSLIRERDREE